MKILKIHKLLKEYNKSGQKMTTLAAPGGEKASGKNYDNMITGASQPYKITNDDTQYMKICPVLTRYVKSVKKDSLGGKKLVDINLIADELRMLNKISRIKKDENGNFILPFGDGIRLEKDERGFFFISSEKKESKTNNEMNDNLLVNL